MESRGAVKRKEYTDGYTKEQIAAVLSSIGVTVDSQTHQVFVCYCPYHGNTDTPSFAVNDDNGLFICFNPSCGKSGTLTELVKHVTKRNDFEAMRYIASKHRETFEALDNRMRRVLEDRPTFVPWPEDKLKELQDAMTSDSAGMAYMKGRGFTEETVRHFGMGYSSRRHMVAVPLHAPDDMLVGIIGRSVEGKDFNNSKHLPTSKTFFNLNRAKKVGNIAIVVEASFDAMRIHQAGFPNAIATLGGHISPDKFALLDRHFDKIVVMTDYDDPAKNKRENCQVCKNQGMLCQGHNPGRELGMKIGNSLRNKEILWACYGYQQRYPVGKKDPCELTDDEIQRCIKNAVPHIEYISWGLHAQ